ncbi:MAG: O-antigen ligase family protein [Candidatus Promineifilaceae bacterium]
MSYQISLLSQRLARGQWQPGWSAALALILGLLVAWLPPRGAAVIVLGGGLTLVGLVQPLVLLTLTLMAGPLGALENLMVPGAPLESGQILLLAALGAWIGRGILRRELSLPSTRLNRPLLIFLGVALLSLLGARSLTFGLKELAKWAEIGLIMLMTVDLTLDRAGGNGHDDVAWRRPVRTRWLVAVLLTAALSQAAVGIWQFFFAGAGPEHFMIFERFYRAYGTFQQPNPYGGYMAMGALLAIGAALGLAAFLLRALWQRKTLTWPDLAWLAFFLISAGVLGLALVLSWSRGAWLGFAVGLGMLALFLPKRRWLGGLLLIGAITLLAIVVQLNLLPMTLTGRLTNLGQDLRLGEVLGVDIDDGNYAVIERLAHWQAAVGMAEQNPWLGVGFGNYEPAYPDYGLINWPFPLGHAHNYYLNILAETGVLGLVAYLLFWLVVFIQAIFLLRRLDWPDRGIALGLLVAWAALAAHHLVDKLYVNNLYLYMGFMLGLQQVLDRKHD